MTLSWPGTLRFAWFLSVLAVIAGSLLPGNSAMLHLIGKTGISDKVQHFTAYAVLAGLPALHQFGCRRVRLMLAAVVALGLALEVAQLQVPGRSCDWHDAVADAGGALFGVALAAAANERLRTS
jgi:VanZ family protein